MCPGGSQPPTDDEIHHRRRAVGEFVRSTREEREMSVTEFARCARIDPRTLKDLEATRGTTTSWRTLVAVAAELGMLGGPFELIAAADTAAATASKQSTRRGRSPGQGLRRDLSRIRVVS